MSSTKAATPEGQRAYDILSWANEDVRSRARDALRRVQNIGRTLMNQGQDAALMEVGDVSTVLGRIVNGLPPEEPESDQEQPMISAQIEQSNSISSQFLDMAAIAGRHIPGTSYTYRHGWVPLIGPQLVDKYPQWFMDQNKMKTRPAPAPPGDQPDKVAPRLATVSRPGVTQGAAGVSKADVQAALQKPPEHVVARPQKLSSAQRRQEAIARLTAKQRAPQPAVSPRAAELQAKASALVKAASPAPSGQSALPGMPAPPKTAADISDDNAFQALGLPGAQAKALKAYIDARVATEVAAQMGQIDKTQHTEINKHIKALHESQQRLIRHMRGEVKTGSQEENRVIRTKLVMNNIFNMSALAVALGGVTMGVSPVIAALAAAAIPAANIIHDYVRKLG